MSRIRPLLAALLLAVMLVLPALLWDPPSAFAGPGNPPNWCFQPNDQGDLPTCTNTGGEWHRSYDSDAFGDDSGIPGAFVAFFLLVLVGGIATVVWKVSTARRMARESGMNEGDATAMTLLTDDGFEATYLAANLRGQTGPAAPSQTPASSVADRLKELGGLRDQGLITTEEYDARRAAIIDSV